MKCILNVINILVYINSASKHASSASVMLITTQYILLFQTVHEGRRTQAKRKGGMWCGVDINIIS